MKKTFLYVFYTFLTLLPFQLIAECFPDKQFKKFIEKEKLFTLSDIKSPLLKYAKIRAKSIACVEKMAKAMLLDEAIKWKQAATSNRCFDIPPGKACPEETRNEIFGHFTSLEQLFLSIENDPTKCQYQNFPYSTSQKLTEDTVDILRVLNKFQRLEENLQLDRKNCEEGSIVRAEDSPNLQYFKALLAKGVDAPLDEFLKLWYPGEKELEGDPYFSKCEEITSDYEYGNLDYLIEDCKPDALYSWGPAIKLENMKKALSDDESWQGSSNPINGQPTTLFMAKTPVSSFGYGDIAIRVKLKKGTPFPYQHHTSFNEGEKDYTQVDGVMMNRSWYHDYMLENSTFIESWSYGTPQLYDEMVRDILRFKNKKSAEVYANHNEGDPQKGLENLFNQRVDKKDFSEKELKRKLIKHIDMVIRGEGRVHFQKGSCRNQGLHYKTDKPTYFNPN